MDTTIRDLLEAQEIQLKDTIYWGEDEVLSFPMNMPDAWSIGEKDVFAYTNISDQKKQYYDQLKEELRNVKEELAEIKRAELTEKSWERMYQLKERKNDILSKLLDFRQAFMFKELRYKKFLEVVGHRNLLQYIPQLSYCSDSIWSHMPHFVNNLENLQEALKSGEAIGVVGGPCLFGRNEVLMQIKTLKSTKR